MSATESGSTETIILHQFPRNPQLPVPNMSPACLKLETYIRMAKLPYKVDTAFRRSSEGKFPWIEHNGKKIADSAFCISYLKEAFGVDLDSGLSEEQKAVSTAFRVMLEENTNWTLIQFRMFSEQTPEFRDKMMHAYPAPVKYLGFWKVQRTMRTYLDGHGIGRHSEAEIYSIAERDLRAVSTFLGSKKFLFGDEPCVTDASIFGLVANFLWGFPGSPQEKAMNEDMKNLVEHAQRIKDTYYQDWEELVSGEEKKAPAEEETNSK